MPPLLAAASSLPLTSLVWHCGAEALTIELRQLPSEAL